MANRWPPWIEAAARCDTRKTGFTSTTASALSGTAITVTPKIATRAQLIGSFDMHCTAFVAATNLIGELFVAVDGGAAAAVTGQALYRPSAADERVTQTTGWTYDMAAGSTYVFDLRVRCGAGGNTFTIYETHSVLCLVAMPSEGISY